MHVYKEYFLLKVASILKVGPNLCTPFGYGIIVTRNEAFFGMELCQNLKGRKLKQIEQQSLENLRVMHSLNFVHIDIKPGNLAYSQDLQKCIFLDFGLSELIEESPGHQITTGFVGTLSYCSDEMKKTYLLNKKRPVDLYYNDMVSFQKALRVIQGRNLCQKQHQISNQNISQIKYYEFERSLNSIEESAHIFQLKFYIFFNNVELFMKSLPKLQHMPNSFFQILDSKTTQRFIDKNELMRDPIAKIRAKILKQKIMGNVTDDIFSEALIKTNENDGAIIFALSKHIISLPNRQFELLIEDQIFIGNILLELEEFSKQESRSLNSQKSRIVLRLIRRVNEIKRPKIDDEPLTFYEQISFFLKFINQGLKKKRTYKILSVLRMLFIKMDELKSIQTLQDEILDQVTDPTLKCLKITQFILCFGSMPWKILNITKIRKEKR